MQHRSTLENRRQASGAADRQDGKSASLTAPNGRAQQGLLAALADAGSSAAC